MMRRLNPAQYANEMRARGLGPRALGNYGDGNPNTLNVPPYSEREVFRGEQTNMGASGIIAEPMPIPVIRNRNFFNLLQFSFEATDGSRVLLPANEMRSFLTVQNQSLADMMYVNFTTEAGVNAGIELYPAQALIYDQVVPYNSITVFVNSATKQLGVVCEGALQL